MRFASFEFRIIDMEQVKLVSSIRSQGPLHGSAAIAAAASARR